MTVPMIHVVTRFIPSSNWENGFPIHCVKYPNGRYSSMFDVEKTFKEVDVYQGPCPEKLRILTKVDPRFLHRYMHFYSQVIPRGLDEIVAAAVRGTCNGIFDHECYLPNGVIISHEPINHSEEVDRYLHMFFRKEDHERIERMDWCFDEWGDELYQKEMSK